MILFLEIFGANVALLFVLIAVHECGHWLMGRVAGIPAGAMKIRLFTFPQRVDLRDGQELISVKEFDRYNALLLKHVPSRRGRFLFVVGGFLAETCLLIALTILLAASGVRLYAIVVPGVSLLMYLIYVLVMDIPQARSVQRPYGDTTILYSLTPAGGAAVAGFMIIARIALMLAVWLKLI
jgi:hypothetical protein